MVSVNLPVGAERAEHLVGRDVLEAEARARVRVERAPIGERGLEQRVGAADIGLDEGRGTVDRAVDVALRREMQDGVGLRLGEDRVERRPVADVHPVMAMAVAGAGFGQRFEVAGVGQHVDVGHRPVGGANHMPHGRRADEPGAASNQDLHTCTILSDARDRGKF